MSNETIEIQSKKLQANVIIDSSVMNTFEKCPTLMKYQYIDNLRLKGVKSKALEKGDLFHVGAKYYYRAKKENKDWSECVKIGTAKILRYAPTLSLEAKEIEDVSTTFLSYCEFYRFEKWTILEVERPFRIVIYEDNELRIIFQGKIDLIVDTGQMICPVDHKTESRRSEPIALSEQFLGYTYASKSSGLIVNKVGFQASLKAEEKYYRKLLSYDDDILNEWRDEFVFKVRELINYAEIDFFPHRYTSCQDKYGICIFHDVCKTPQVARDGKLKQLFEVGEPWDPFKDLEAEMDKEVTK